MKDKTLPKLPKPAGWNYDHGGDMGTAYYSEAQMIAYALSSRTSPEPGEWQVRCGEFADAVEDIADNAGLPKGYVYVLQNVATHLRAASIPTQLVVTNDAELAERVAKLEEWAHEPFDFSHLIARLEAVESALTKQGSSAALTPASNGGEINAAWLQGYEKGQQVPTVPEQGWALVPLEPTTEMLCAYHRAKHEGPKPTTIPDLWRALLDAAPAHPKALKAGE